MGHEMQAPPLRSPAVHHKQLSPKMIQKPHSEFSWLYLMCFTSDQCHVQENPRNDCLEKYLIELPPMLMCVLICFSQPSNHPQPPLHSDGRDCGDDIMNDLGRPASEAQTRAGGSWGGASRSASPQHPHHPPAPSTWGPQASGSHTTAPSNQPRAQLCPRTAEDAKLIMTWPFP